MAEDAQVKNFEAIIVADHKQTGNELKSLAAGEGISLPDSIKPEHRQMFNNMTKKSGKEFDKDYINVMVNDHQKVIDAFKEESSNGKTRW
jgi:putative membrane protein